MSESTCGVQQHPDTCLCDVHLGEPVPIDCSLQDSWVLSMVADYLELSWPWDADKLGMLMEASSRFLEAFYYEMGATVATTVPERGNMDKPQWWNVIKEIVADHYGSFNEPPDWEQVLTNACCELEDFVHAFSGGRQSVDDWSFARLNELRDDINTGMLSKNKVCDKYGLNKKGSAAYFYGVIKQEGK